MDLAATSPALNRAPGHDSIPHLLALEWLDRPARLDRVAQRIRHPLPLHPTSHPSHAHIAARISATLLAAFDPRELDDLSPPPTHPLTPRGTPFQLAVWAHLSSIPRGTTTTYAHIARALNRPDAVRAVANAIAANPIAILIPCHRVIGTHGDLTGYAGGIDRKRALLDLEGALPLALITLPPHPPHPRHPAATHH
jgi:O-6-methylguanine DNA methyltransferase